MLLNSKTRKPVRHRNCPVCQCPVLQFPESHGINPSYNRYYCYYTTTTTTIAAAAIPVDGDVHELLP